MIIDGCVVETSLDSALKAALIIVKKRVNGVLLDVEPGNKTRIFSPRSLLDTCIVKCMLIRTGIERQAVNLTYKLSNLQ